MWCLWPIVALVVKSEESETLEEMSVDIRKSEERKF